MVKNFYRDLNKARSAEKLVKDVFSQLTDNYDFEEVGNNRAYFHKGDIIATGKDGRKIMIEVKDDGVIYKSGNVLCEEEVYYDEIQDYIKGNMYSDYQIYCVVSQPERAIYVIDFNKLRENYKKGEYKEIKHYDQTSICYLCNLAQVKQWGALIKKVKY